MNGVSGVVDVDEAARYARAGDNWDTGAAGLVKLVRDGLACSSRSAAAQDVPLYAEAEHGIDELRVGADGGVEHADFRQLFDSGDVELGGGGVDAV